VALLMVLLIVIAITILATGFGASTDAELACGTNTLLRLQMDQLAESGLEHARALVLHPQDVPGDFWAKGAVAQQLLAESRDYYDVQVAPDTSRPLDHCTFDITSEAYRLVGSDRTGRSRLTATLRLDPCLALAVGADSTLWNGLNICGDVWAKNSLTNQAALDGDVFFGVNFIETGTRTGRLNPQPLTLAWPPVTTGYSNPLYVTRTLGDVNLSAGAYEPAAIWMRTGDLTVSGTVRLQGMLLVTGNLTLSAAAGGSQMVAARNLPALYVHGTLVIDNINGLVLEGLVVVDGDVHIGAAAANISITGSLFVGGALDGPGSGTTISADPMKAAVVKGVFPNDIRWSPAAGGFLGRLGRQ
jgi:hypothetical protein